MAKEILNNWDTKLQIRTKANWNFTELYDEKESVRPIETGWTNATTASGARTNLWVAYGTTAWTVLEGSKDAEYAKLTGGNTFSGNNTFNDVVDIIKWNWGNYTDNNLLSDCNDANKSGFYWVIPSTLNNPLWGYANILVLADNSSYARQIIYKADDSWKRYIRSKNAGVWGVWKQYWTDTSAWEDYTPAVTAWSSTWITTIWARYKQQAWWKICTWGFQINIASPDTSISELTISLPVTWPYYQSAMAVFLYDNWTPVSSTAILDWNIITIYKIWWNFTGFLVLRWSFTYETN